MVAMVAGGCVMLVQTLANLLLVRWCLNRSAIRPAMAPTVTTATVTPPPKPVVFYTGTGTGTTRAASGGTKP